LDLIRKYRSILPAKSIRGLFVLIFIVFFSGSFEVIGVASVLPFIALLANSELISTNEYFNAIYVFLNFNSHFDFFVFIGCITFLILLTSLAFRALSQHLSIKYALAQEYVLGKRLFNIYLNKSYRWYIEQNTADLSKNIVNEVNQVVYNGILPAINMLSNIVVVLGIMIFLIIINWIIAINTMLIFGSLYLLIFFLIRSKMKSYGDKRLGFNKKRFAVLSNAFSGIKELKIFGLEDDYINSFGKSASIYADAQIKAQTVAQVPRNLVEAVAFGGMVLLTIYLMYTGEDLSQIVGLLSIYAVAGYRLMPALQQIYYAFSLMRFAAPGVNILYNEVSDEKNLFTNKNTNEENFKLPFDTFSLENLAFRYNPKSLDVLFDINLTLHKGKKYALVGTTGAGKTTLIDILAGLSEPTNGLIKIKNNNVNIAGSKMWYASLGYLPQQIGLIDDTVKRNIVLKTKLTSEEEEWLNKVLKISCVDEFLEHHKDGIDTLVGEKGIKFSGGQIQRIGLARAIFKKPSFMILDEATSALDPSVEEELLKRLDLALPDTTIIHISHKENVINKCDVIFFLKDGIIGDYGSYTELEKKSQEFRNLLNK
tara:strand:- start:3789 stop:5576 length:1788 start_codon:yes stop_codon:yes gene_type:complete